MQQLSTGKKRLPGFDRKWKTKLLKQLSEKQKKKDITLQCSLVLSNSAQHGVVSQDQEFDKEVANKERIDGYYIIVPGAFAYNPRISVAAPCGPINVNETGETGITSPPYMVSIIFSSEINQDYLKYHFQSPCWHKYVKGVVNYGTGCDRISISDEDPLATPISLSPKEGQTAIAEALSVTNRGFDLLRQKIEQEEQKKEALVQLLLTGIMGVQFMVIYYNKCGKTSVYSQNKHTFGLKGIPLVFVNNNAVCNLRGKHLGYFENGWIRNKYNRAVPYTGSCTGFGPVPPVREIAPIPPIPTIPPISPIPPIVPIPPVATSTWSTINALEFFER